MRRVFLPLAALILAASFEPAAAAMVGDASVPFRAERILTVGTHTYTGLLFHTPGHQRHEQDLMGMREVFLLDTATAEGELVLPALKTYVAFPFPPLMADLASPDLLHSPVGAGDDLGHRARPSTASTTTPPTAAAPGAICG